MSIAEAELFADVRRVANRALWRPVLGFLRGHRVRIVAFLGLCATSTALSLVQPFFFREIIDAALGQRAHRAGIAFAPTRSLAVLTALLIVVGTLNTLSTLAVVRYQARLGHVLLAELQSAVYDRVQRLPYGFFIHANPGAIVNRISGEASYAAFSVPSVLNGAFTALLSLVAGVILLVAYDWRLLLVLVIICAFLVPSQWIRRRVKSHAVDQVEVQSAAMGMMHERLSVSGALLTRLFGLRADNLATFEAQTARYRDLGVEIAWWQGFGQAIVGMGTVVTLAGVAWFGGRAVADGSLTVGTLALLFFYVRIIAAPIQSYGSIRFEVTRGLVAFGRVFEVRDYQHAVLFGTVTEPGRAGALSFDHVSFRYPDPATLVPPSLRYADARPDGAHERPLVLDDVSFDVEPGQFVALVGSSGSGKSTIAALAARLFDATTGAIRIGGSDIRDLAESTLVTSVGLVTQDTLLFHDTIRANLLLARPDATDKEMVRACVAAGIHQFIRSLPAGYGTVVGERGVRLSGGQRQRLAFARIVLLDPSIIVLDEATAHLDAESESLLREAVESVLSGRTRLVIAHRLSTVVDADEILVLEHGRIVERGHHTELMTAGGRYRQLYQTQLLSDDGPTIQPVLAANQATIQEALDVTP